MTVMTTGEARQQLIESLESRMERKYLNDSLSATKLAFVSIDIYYSIKNEDCKVNGWNEIKEYNFIFLMTKLEGVVGVVEL